MITEALQALASAGSSALVTAMVNDGWESAKARFAHLLARGDATKAEAAARRLEQSREALVQVLGPDREHMRTEQQIEWQARLKRLLEQDPRVERELRTLIGQVQAQATASAGPVEQHAAAFDQAQQAFQGHGMQNITFGRGEPGGSGR